MVDALRCDAEPGALADYILALLKHNAPENELRQETSAQLEEFLEKGKSRAPPTISAPTYLRISTFKKPLLSSTHYSLPSERNHIFLTLLPRHHQDLLHHQILTQ